MKSFRDAAKVSAAKKIKGYATGGRVEEDISENDAPPVMTGSSSLDDGASIEGAPARSRLDRPAKKAPATSVNIVVMSGKDKAPAPAGGPPGLPAVPSAPLPPPAPPMGASGAGPMPPMGAGAPPMMGRKTGGRVMMDGGSGGGRGRLEKIKAYGKKGK